MRAQGQLFLLEFAARKTGQAKIEFNLSDTTLLTEGKVNLQLSGKSVQVVIGEGEK